MLSPGWGEGGALRSQKLLQPEAAASKKVAKTVLKEPYRGLHLRDMYGMAQTVKASAYNVGDPGRGDPLEKEMATDSSILPGKSHRWRSLVGYSPWGRKESDMTERLHFTSSDGKQQEEEDWTFLFGSGGRSTRLGGWALAKPDWPSEGSSEMVHLLAWEHSFWSSPM